MGTQEILPKSAAGAWASAGAIGTHALWGLVFVKREPGPSIGRVRLTGVIPSVRYALPGTANGLGDRQFASTSYQSSAQPKYIEADEIAADQPLTLGATAAKLSHKRPNSVRLCPNAGWVLQSRCVTYRSAGAAQDPVGLEGARR